MRKRLGIVLKLLALWVAASISLFIVYHSLVRLVQMFIRDVGKGL